MIRRTQSSKRKASRDQSEGFAMPTSTRRRSGAKQGRLSRFGFSIPQGDQDCSDSNQNGRAHASAENGAAADANRNPSSDVIHGNCLVIEAMATATATPPKTAAMREGKKGILSNGARFDRA